MRLAAEYHQPKKPPASQKEESAGNYIVKLGKGRPTSRHRRGISLFNGKGELSEQSLGREEMSREKRREIQQESRQLTQMAPKPVGSPKPVVSAVTYSVKALPVVPSYATEHLQVATKPQLHSDNLIKTVRSSERIVRQPQSRYVAGLVQPKIEPQAMRIQRTSRPVSIDKKIVIPQGPSLSRQPSNLQPHPQAPVATHLPHSTQFQPALVETTAINRIKSCEPLRVTTPRASVKNEEIKSKGRVVIPPQGVKTPHQQGVSHKKIIAECVADPYSLSSSKMTRKMQSSNKNSHYFDSQLRQTRKQQFSNSGSLSLESRGKGIPSGGQISLWDANKVESIVSMRSSGADVRLEESEVMVDYFNP